MKRPLFLAIAVLLLIAGSASAQGPPFAFDAPGLIQAATLASIPTLTVAIPALANPAHLQINRTANLATDEDGVFYAILSIDSSYNHGSDCYVAAQTIPENGPQAGVAYARGADRTVITGTRKLDIVDDFNMIATNERRTAIISPLRI